MTCSALSVWNVNLNRKNNSLSLFWVNDENEMKFSNLYFTWSTYGLFVVILGNVFPDLEIRMSEHALKVSCGPQPIALVPFGQLPHELAVLYVHWKYFIIKKYFSLVPKNEWSFEVKGEGTLKYVWG